MVPRFLAKWDFLPPFENGLSKIIERKYDILLFLTLYIAKMNFGSKYVYVRPAKYPAVKSKAASSSAHPFSFLASLFKKRKSKASLHKTRPPTPDQPEVDTNVLAVKFDVLQQPAHMHTGDPIRCSNKQCQAILSHISMLASVQPVRLSKALLSLTPISCNPMTTRHSSTICR